MIPRKRKEDEIYKLNVAQFYREPAYGRDERNEDKSRTSFR